MSANKPVMHILCGKIAAGKSTLAKQLADRPQTVLLSEDVWLDKLFSDQMSSLQDYVRCAAKLRTIMSQHIPDLLEAGMSVVLDFPANTVETRAWMRRILDQVEVEHQLHWLNVPDEVCLQRLRQRNADGDHPFAATEAQFHQVTKHFVPPMPEEGFNVIEIKVVQ